MGIVVRQTIYSSIFNYLGVLIGFINVTILMTRWFSPDEFGLRGVLLDVSVMYSIIAQMGTFRSLTKFFPFFNREGKSDNGLLSIGLLLSLIGYLIIGALFLVFKETILESFNDDTSLSRDFYWVIFPLSFFLLLNTVFESYFQARSQTIFTSFIRNVFNRVLVTILLVLFYFQYISFKSFILLFMFSYLINVIVYVNYLYKNDELHLKINFKVFTPRVKKVFANYSLYSILAGISGVLINKIDTIMVGYFLGFAFSGVYANAVYLSMLVFVPASAMNNIILPLLSSSFKEKRIEHVKELYQKSSLNQLIIGGGLFVLLWASVDNLYSLQGEIYASGKVVLFILGVTRLVNMAFGVNGQIINISSHYRFDTLVSFLLAGLAIATNYTFIPRYGLNGAAMATLLSFVLFNVIRFWFVYRKLRIQPFNGSTIKVSLILLSAFLINYFLPQIENIYIDTIYRSLILIVIVGTPIYLLKVSEEINQMIDKGLTKVGVKQG